MKRVTAILVLGALLAGGTAQAGSLKYQPVNPSFGGFPGNGAILLEGASAQNKYAAEAAESARSGITDLTPAQEFAQTFQRRLLLSVSDQIVGAIFGENAQSEGVFELEGTVIQFRRVGNNVDLTINDGVNTTRVLVPVAY